MLLTFKEFQETLDDYKKLNEMAIAGEGDWVDNKAFGFITSKVLSLKYKFVDNLEIKNESFEMFVMGDNNKKVISIGKLRKDDGDTKLAVIGSIELRKIPDIMDLHNVWNVDDVRVEEKFQGQGIAKSLYLYLVKTLKMTILGDEVQYFGARLCGVN
jgi:ribosomal protein S18 acetylase RimI-like enzyme